MPRIDNPGNIPNTINNIFNKNVDSLINKYTPSSFTDDTVIVDNTKRVITSNEDKKLLRTYGEEKTEEETKDGETEEDDTQYDDTQYDDTQYDDSETEDDGPNDVPKDVENVSKDIEDGPEDEPKDVSNDEPKDVSNDEPKDVSNDGPNDIEEEGKPIEKYREKIIEDIKKEIVEMKKTPPNNQLRDKLQVIYPDYLLPPSKRNKKIPDPDSQQGGNPCNQFEECLNQVYIVSNGYSDIYKCIARAIIYYQTEIAKEIITLKQEKLDNTADLKQKVEKMNELNLLYIPEKLTIVLNKDTENDYNTLFGNNNCNVYYKVPIPFCLTMKQISQLFQEMYLNNFIIFQQIIEKYNNFQYKIIGKNNSLYIYFEEENKKIPINKSKLYDITIPTGDFEIDEIGITNNEYKYTLHDASKLHSSNKNISLNNINGEKIDFAKQSIERLSTMYKLGDKDVLIENYYYNSKNTCSKGSQTHSRNQLYLLKNFLKEKNIENIENFILIDVLFPQSCVDEIWTEYKTLFGVDLDVVNEYYETKSETTNEILVLVKRKINPRRFISLLLYTSRIYYEKDETHWLGTLYYVIIQLLSQHYYLIDDNIRIIITIQTVLLYMFKKYNVYYSQYFYDNTINGKYISSGKQVGGGFDDWMNSISSIVNKKKMYDFAGDIQKNITHYTEFITGKPNETIDKKIYKWVTCPFIDDYCEPDVTQFIYNYLNDDSINNDLLNIESREKICENIAEIQDKIDSVFSELKLILPKNYFDSETYMNKYSDKYIKTTDS